MFFKNVPFVDVCYLENFNFDLKVRSFFWISSFEKMIISTDFTVINSVKSLPNLDFNN